jgi:ribosomal protein L7/L12
MLHKAAVDVLTRGNRSPRPVISGMIRYVDRSTGGFETRRGFWMARLFPVQGDSAIAELWHDDEIWADVRLEGVQLDVHGEDRITTATAIVRLYARATRTDPDWREHRLDDLLTQLTTARDWLLDNESGRTPVEDGEELSSAGRALSTASTRTVEQLINLVPAASNSDPPNAGTGEFAVALVAVGPTPVELIRTIRSLTGYGLLDARALLTALPSVVMTGLSATDTAKIARSLEAAGATTETHRGSVRPVPRTPRPDEVGVVHVDARALPLADNACMVDQEHERENQQDRAAVEHVRGRPLPTTWPAAALPPGARVWVVKDANWDGPWQTEFVGTIDTMGAPETIDHPHAELGELAYWVTFDEPQLDSAGDGPYRKALIWGRYLRSIQQDDGHQTNSPST